MPKVAKKQYIRLYDAINGPAKAVFYCGGQTQVGEVILEAETLSKLNQMIHDFKRNNDRFRGVRHEARYGEAYSGVGLNSGTRFSINERFDMARDIIKVVAHGGIDSAVFCGRGGCGKSYTLLSELNNLGIAFEHIRGAVTPLELYKLLFENMTATVVFDDCDSVFQHENSVNILKAVLDTTGARVVQWRSNISLDDVPNKFEFLGKVYFISNRQMDRIPDPLQSRAMLIDLDFTQEELIDRMRELAPKMNPRLTAEQREELLDHLEENAHLFKNLSLRTYLKASKIVESGIENWRNTVIFAG